MNQPGENSMEPRLKVPESISPHLHDFVFIDDVKRPYRVRQEGDDLWLHYLHPDKFWVTLRVVKLGEAVRMFLLGALPADKMKLYEFGVPFIPL